MPYLPADETSNIEKKTDESSSKHESLTDEQRSQLRDVLQQMERMVHLDLKGAAPKISYLRTRVVSSFQENGSYWATDR